ncbi:hypothetical protein GG496_000905, partial [Candidatus Fervidibacteria bacterium JGI MDM2 JNZ-1-D12]
MKKFVLALISVILSALPSSAQIIVVRDDKWAATGAEIRSVVNWQVESVERWLRRLRVPYQRVNASALAANAGNLFILPANRPDADLLSKLKNANRVVVFAFVGNQVTVWRQALGINSGNGVVRQNNWV